MPRLYRPGNGTILKQAKDDDLNVSFPDQYHAKAMVLGCFSHVIPSPLIVVYSRSIIIIA